MSLATNIKEFSDVLHNIYAQQLSSLEGTDILSDGVLPLAIPKAVVLQQACLYAVKSFSSGIFYLLSFEWLRDFSYFPLISPEIGSRASENHDTFLAEPASYLFSFSKNGVNLSRYMQHEALQEGATQSGAALLFDVGEALSKEQGVTTIFNGFFKSDSLLAGFVNSFFFSFPFSLPHLITLRRMFSQGAAAAAASIFGIVTAHSLVVVGVLYGIRFLIVPYYSFQPATFVIGSVTIAIIITEFVKEKRVYLVPLTHYPSLVRIGVLSFTLALCESATVFHDLHHLTLNQQITCLQLYESQDAFSSFFVATAYLIAFVFGHAFFSLGFCFLLLKVTEKACSLTGWTLPKTARRMNRALLLFILTLTFSSFPYYGLDYLFTKSAGFLPEDPVYRNTIFSPTQVRSRNRHFKSRAPSTKDSKTPLELDLNYFDRGMYLAAPKEEKIARDFVGPTGLRAENSTSTETVATYDPALTFEELNYQGEAAWLMRHERAKRLSEEPDSKKESVFQKPKTHFKELRLKQDNKQARAALKELPQIGAISEWKEGIRPGEGLSLNDKGINPTTEGAKQSEALSGIAKNFITDGQNQDKTLFLKDLAFEKEIASAYEKSFTSPFGEESDGTPPDLLPVENIIKKRYRLNPIYRALLQTDIDFFIARQPASYRITQNQEASLFKKRQLLENYYNSIRYYSPVEGVGFTKRYLTHFSDGTFQPKGNKVSSSIKPVFSFGSSSINGDNYNESNDRRGQSLRHQESSTSSYGLSTKLYLPFTKSFVETPYHQQFKGTLNTVKRFFKLTFDEEQNPTKNRILSYDQLLYKKQNTSEAASEATSEALSASESAKLSTSKKLPEKASLCKPTPKSLQKQSVENLQNKTFDKNYHPSLHEELSLENISPFIEESNSSPVYAGWDDKARRFVITNRFNLIK